MVSTDWLYTAGMWPFIFMINCFGGPTPQRKPSVEGKTKYGIAFIFGAAAHGAEEWGESIQPSNASQDPGLPSARLLVGWVAETVYFCEQGAPQQPAQLSTAAQVSLVVWPKVMLNMLHEMWDYIQFCLMFLVSQGGDGQPPKADGGTHSNSTWVNELLDKHRGGPDSTGASKQNLQIIAHT